MDVVVCCCDGDKELLFKAVEDVEVLVFALLRFLFISFIDDVVLEVVVIGIDVVTGSIVVIVILLEFEFRVLEEGEELNGVLCIGKCFVIFPGFFLV